MEKEDVLCLHIMWEKGRKMMMIMTSTRQDSCRNYRWEWNIGPPMIPQLARSDDKIINKTITYTFYLSLDGSTYTKRVGSSSASVNSADFCNL